MPTPLDDLRAAVEAAAADLLNGSAPRTSPTLERPKRADHGDYSTNAAMLLAPALRAAPREVAERLAEALSARLGERLERVEVAGPGFLNVFLADAWYSAAAAHVLDAAEGFGGGGADPAERVLVEFVSANPTGPAHVGHARNAAYGDAVARLLAFRGHAVEREYYVNDYGTQVQRFGESLKARARGEEVAEGGYKGAYITEIAEQIPGAAEMDVETVARRGIELMLERIGATLRRFRVEMDHWFSERSLHVAGEGGPSLVEHAFERLEQQGSSYRSEGALWVRTSQFGDDKDRVIERSSGEHTYFASDIAYHQEKRERGFDRLIDVWGADHHGYVQRMQAMFEALGGDPDRLELLIMQFVHLVEGGGRASMSKRAGEFVTLDELIDEVGVDAARWFLLARSHDTAIDLDLDLAREQSNENPVYYVQYAHARIASILREARGRPRTTEAGHALDPSERELIKKLLGFPAEVAEAADRRAPHRVATYALQLAQSFTAFYRDCRVLGVSEEPFRLALCDATRGVIARSLDLLGIAAPQSM